MTKENIEITELEGTPLRESANIPTMEQVPGTSPTDTQGDDNTNNTNNNCSDSKK
ncbi:MAG: hypothetical protein OEY58_19735 [Gammaproteobacteria bacterium]|nr:hypothetical protein [Gammaproteobacteria bacterium]